MAVRMWSLRREGRLWPSPRASGFVALGAVVAVDERAGRDGLRLAGQGIGAGVIFGRDVVPVGMGGGGKGQRGAEDEGRKRKKFAAGMLHCAPPLAEWNQLPI